MPDDALGPLTPAARRHASERIRIGAAETHEDIPAPVHHQNGDEARYAAQNYYASFSKGLQHDPATGEVVGASYQSLRAALESGRPSDFEEIVLGVSTTQSSRLTNPQAGLAFDLEGVDGHQVTMPPCYTFRSAGSIGEMRKTTGLPCAATCRSSNIRPIR